MAQDTETVDFTKQGYKNQETVSAYTGTNFQIAFSKGTNKNNTPKYYTSGTAIRLYGNNTMTISSTTKKIKEITFTYTLKNTENLGFSTTSGSYNTNSNKWTSDSKDGISEVTLTNKIDGGHYRLTQLTVTFVGGAETPNAPEAPTITPASKTFSESFTATISCTDAAAKIYYTLDGNTPDANSTPYTRGITIPEETTTLKAVAIKDGKASKVADAVYTYVAVTPEKPNASNIYTIWSEDWSKYKKDDKPTEGSNATYECKNGGSITKIYNEEIAGGTAPELLISKLEGALTINILDLKNFFGTLYFSLTSNADKINLSSATENITLGKFTKEGKKYTCAITIPQGTKGLNLKIENKIKNNIRVDDLSLFAKIGSFTITSARYGTYYTEDAFVMPEGVTGYTITEKDGESLTLNAAYPANEVVPAKTALLLKATETPATNKDFTYTIVNSDKVAPEGNLLHGSVEATKTQVEGATAYYKLAKGEEGIGFYWANENGTAFTNGANKAYLAITGKLSQMRGFSFESMTTGINNVVANTNNSKNAVIYDLNGRRINTLNAAKGVYIVNGKKVIVK